MRAPLLARGSSLSTWKDEMVLIDETLFCRLLADLDHIARLRDNGHTLGDDLLVIRPLIHYLA